MEFAVVLPDPDPGVGPAPQVSRNGVGGPGPNQRPLVVGAAVVCGLPSAVSLAVFENQDWVWWLV